MRTIAIIPVVISCLLSGLSAQTPSAPQPLATHFDFSSDTTPGARKFYYETIPGRRYSLWRSADLQSWTRVAGHPFTAAGPTAEFTFTQGAKEYFRIESLDDQPPEIVSQFPGVSAYGVRRFDDLRFELKDASGINPTSIRLTVGSAPAMAVGAAGLTWSGNTLTWDSGDTALGAYGASIPVTLTVADTMGHILTHSFSFTLEV